MTTLQTFKAIINGTLVVVDQLKGNNGRQDIRYKINGTIISADSFWLLRPVKVN